jgi:GTPase SAR1 family protein
MSSVCKHLKVVVVGDGATGKSHLVLTFVNKDFIGSYNFPGPGPKRDESRTHTVVDGQLIQFHLWSTPGLFNKLKWFLLYTS